MNIVDEISGNGSQTSSTVELQGGDLYYLHFVYDKDNVDLDPVYDDSLYIYSISLTSDTIVTDTTPTIELLKDVTDTSTVNIDKNINLDTNNYTITKEDQSIQIAENGTLNLYGTGKITGEPYDDGTIVVNNGVINIYDNLTIENTVDSRKLFWLLCISQFWWNYKYGKRSYNRCKKWDYCCWW